MELLKLLILKNKLDDDLINAMNSETKKELWNTLLMLNDEDFYSCFKNEAITISSMPEIIKNRWKLLETEKDGADLGIFEDINKFNAYVRLNNPIIPSYLLKYKKLKGFNKANTTTDYDMSLVALHMLRKKKVSYLPNFAYKKVLFNEELYDYRFLSYENMDDCDKLIELDASFSELMASNVRVIEITKNNKKGPEFSPVYVKLKIDYMNKKYRQEVLGVEDYERQTPYPLLQEIFLQEWYFKHVETNPEPYYIENPSPKTIINNKNDILSNQQIIVEIINAINDEASTPCNYYPDASTMDYIVYSDEWYIVITDNNSVASNCLDYDPRAVKEYRKNLRTVLVEKEITNDNSKVFVLRNYRVKS